MVHSSWGTFTSNSSIDAVLTNPADISAFQFQTTQEREFTKKDFTGANGENFAEIFNGCTASGAANRGRSKASNKHLDTQLSRAPGPSKDQSTHKMAFKDRKNLDFEVNKLFQYSIVPKKKRLSDCDWSAFYSDAATTYNANHRWISVAERLASRPVSGHRKPEMGRVEDTCRAMGGRGKTLFTTSHAQDTFNADAVTFASGVNSSCGKFEPKDEFPKYAHRSGKLRSEYQGLNRELEKRYANARRSIRRATSSPGGEAGGLAAIARRPFTR
jgi:hypothetical protein